MSELLSAADVAAEIGCDGSTVRRRAAALKIGQQIGSSWVFTRADAKKLAKLIRPGQAGNPNMGKGFAHQNRKGRPPSTREN